MDVLEYKYFVVTGGKALEVIENAKLKHQEWVKDCAKLADEYGLNSFRGSEGHIWYLDVTETQQKTLLFIRFEKKIREWLPNKKTEYGKALALRISELNDKYKGLETVAESMFDGETWMFEGRIMRRPFYGTAPGDKSKYIVALPRKSVAVPCDGLEQIKASEYARMVEEEAEKEKAGKGGAE